MNIWTQNTISANERRGSMMSDSIRRNGQNIKRAHGRVQKEYGRRKEKYKQ